MRTLQFEHTHKHSLSTSLEYWQVFEASEGRNIVHLLWVTKTHKERWERRVEVRGMEGERARDGREEGDSYRDGKKVSDISYRV